MDQGDLVWWGARPLQEESPHKDPNSLLLITLHLCKSKETSVNLRYNNLKLPLVMNSGVPPLLKEHPRDPAILGDAVAVHFTQGDVASAENTVAGGFRSV